MAQDFVLHALFKNKKQFKNEIYKVFSAFFFKYLQFL